MSVEPRQGSLSSFVFLVLLTLCKFELFDVAMAEAKQYGLKDHWKCAVACLLISMSPFQYGVDFSLIGPLQAMIGFLKARLVTILLKSSEI